MARPRVNPDRDRSHFCYCPDLQIETGVDLNTSLCLWCKKFVVVMNEEEYSMGLEHCSCRISVPNAYFFCHVCTKVVTVAGRVPEEAYIGFDRAFQLFLTFEYHWV
jgi:hypothetical protein